MQTIDSKLKQELQRRVEAAIKEQAGEQARRWFVEALESLRVTAGGIEAREPPPVARKCFLDGDWTRPKRRSPANTPKQARARRLQGRYIGLLNGLSGAARARVKAVAKRDGVAAAVKMARGVRS